MPDPREIRVYTPDELKAIVAELGPLEAAAVRFAAATGLRAAEWASVERRDIDKARRVVFVPGPRRRVPGVRFRSPRQRSQHSRTCPRGSTAATSSRRPGSAPVGTSPARLTSRTSGDVSGDLRSIQLVSPSPPESTTCARRSSRTHSRTASRCSRRLGSRGEREND